MLQNIESYKFFSFFFRMQIMKADTWLTLPQALIKGDDDTMVALLPTCAMCQTLSK